MGGGMNEKEDDNHNREVAVDKSIHIHNHYHYNGHQLDYNAALSHLPLPAGQAPSSLSATAPPHTLPLSTASALPQPHPLKIFCRANNKYNLTIRNDTLVLSADDKKDECQQWIRYNSDIKDEKGSRAFALVNKSTGRAIKHSFGHSRPVRLLPYNPDYLDESLLWTESVDKGDGFRGIRMVNNIHLHFDAIRGDKFHEGVHDGTGVQLYKWWNGDNFNQQWKMQPWFKDQMIEKLDVCGVTRPSFMK